MLLLTDSFFSGYSSNFGSDDNPECGNYRDGSDGSEDNDGSVVMIVKLGSYFAK